jgi:hypothetical protein
MFSLLMENSLKPSVLFFILYAAIPPPPTPNKAAPDQEFKTIKTKHFISAEILGKLACD